jgi:outer membrane protein assembly factor BamB
VSNPLAFDSTGSVWTLAANLELFRTTPSAAASKVTTLEGAVTGPIILANDVVVTSSPNQLLQATKASGTAPWEKSAVLNGVPAMPLALGNGTMVVPTSTGRLCLVDTQNGAALWSFKLSETGQPLQPANLWTEPGAKTSTAYVSGADGKLYAVIVDGALDTAAPWPKAYHDPQNTSNAGYVP